MAVNANKSNRMLLLFLCVHFVAQTLVILKLSCKRRDVRMNEKNMVFDERMRLYETGNGSSIGIDFILRVGGKHSMALLFTFKKTGD